VHHRHYLRCIALTDILRIRRYCVFQLGIQCGTLWDTVIPGTYKQGNLIVRLYQAG